MEEFKLRMPDIPTGDNLSLFQSTSPVERKQEYETILIATAMLEQFREHPFKLCTGQQYDDLKESIQLNGILQPLLVRHIAQNRYEVLAGHNRLACARDLGIAQVPCIIMDVNDDEAMLIVTETNLYQRSFTDLSHSERAKALAVHMDANKKQGRRTDLLNEVKNLLNASDNAGSGTYVPMEHKLNAREEIEKKYALTPSQISRYLRIDKLISELKHRVDDESIALRSGVELSYLSVSEQEDLDAYLEQGYKIDMNKAKDMRSLSEKQQLDAIRMEQILNGTYKQKKTNAKRKPIALSTNLVSKYFGNYTQDKEVIRVVDTSLEIYTENRKYFSEEQSDDDVKEIYRKALEQYFADVGDKTDM